MSSLLVAPRARVRVLISDSDNMGSQLMAGALGRCRNEFEVVGIASNSQEAVRQIEERDPDIALLSPGLRDDADAGLAVLKNLRDSSRRAAPIMLLHTFDRETVVDAFRGGARGVISRGDSFKTLAKCIRCVHSGQIWANNSQIEYILEALTQAKPRPSKSNGLALLTSREREVVALVAEGMKNREIAQKIHVTEHTVSNYLYRVFEKLGISSRAELILYSLSK